MPVGVFFWNGKNWFHNYYLSSVHLCGHNLSLCHFPVLWPKKERDAKNWSNSSSLRLITFAVPVNDINWHFYTMKICVYFTPQYRDVFFCITSRCNENSGFRNVLFQVSCSPLMLLERSIHLKAWSFRLIATRSFLFFNLMTTLLLSFVQTQSRWLYEFDLAGTWLLFSINWSLKCTSNGAVCTDCLSLTRNTM